MWTLDALSGAGGSNFWFRDASGGSLWGAWDFPGVPRGGPFGDPNLYPSGLEGFNVWSRGASKLGSQGFLEVSLEVQAKV